MSHGDTGGPARLGPGLPGSPEPPRGGARRPGGPAGNSAALLLVAVLTLLGGLLSFLALLSAQNAARAQGHLAEPLRVLPVTAQVPGRCPTAGRNTIEDLPRGLCLTVDAEGGLVTDRLREVLAVADPANPADWRVRISFHPEDAAAFGKLTTEVAARRPPFNQLAMLHGDRLLTTATLPEPITGGTVLLGGGYTRAQAEDLADELRA